ncbi:MAG: restriction endonuclease subunit S [Erysipelotrichaceae bacterium]|nr:restriction endonuclease subunit S [Erysipelotrichaceae bacterium]
MPFEIPDSWEWVRLGSIGDWGSGATPSRSIPEYYNGDIPWLKTGDLNDGYIEYIPEKISRFALEKTSVRLNPTGSVLIAMYGATIGKVGILTFPSTTNQACCACLPIEIYNEYLFYFLMSQKTAFIKQGEGGAQPNISKEKIVATLMPLPPLAEQYRIVDKIKKLLLYIEIYGNAQSSLNSLIASFPDLLKKSILQEAIQGKLVPQDPNDEPANVLLKQIREEKQRLIKEGKIKKDKHESIIFKRDNSYYEKRGSIEVCIDEEIPFEIPNSWEWTRLNNICTKLVDGDHNPPKGSLTKTKYIMASSTNINNDTLVEMEKVRYLTKEIFEKENERTRVEKGDIFFTSVGSLGRTCVYTGGLNISFQRSVSVITTSIFNYYLKYCLDSEYIQQKIKRDATGTAQKGFYLNQLSKLLIPIPPEKEQHRIFDALNHIFSMISAL